MSGFYPQTGSAEEWNTAYYRLEDYLRAHGVVNKIHQSQTILRLLHRAAEKHRTAPGHPPLELAFREAYAEMVRWFQRIFPGSQVSPGRLCSMGRVSLYILKANERWPNIFLSEDALPADFIQAMQETFVQSGPDLRVSTMIPKSPETPSIAVLWEETWQRLDELFSVGLFCLTAVGWMLFQ